ncbi:hypothetical protein CsatA_019903 [Cannabis sativa]
MKIFREDRSWFWANFKYENLSTFCFICGILGHSERFCPKLFHTPAHLIQKPYGLFLKANAKRASEKIGAKWLRSGAAGGVLERGEGSSDVVTPAMFGAGQTETMEEAIEGRGNRGLAAKIGGVGVMVRDLREEIVEGDSNGNKEDIHVINSNDFIAYSDPKRKRADSKGVHGVSGLVGNIGPSGGGPLIDVLNYEDMEQDGLRVESGSKNEKLAGSGFQTRLSS